MKKAPFVIILLVCACIILGIYWLLINSPKPVSQNDSTTQNQETPELNETKETASDNEYIKEEIPELQENPNRELIVFATPINSDYVIYKSILPDTDNPGGKLYRYNPETNRYKLMVINEVYDGFFGGSAMSPDQQHLAWVPNTDESTTQQKMYLLDLVNDTYNIQVELSGNETFNAGAYALSAHFDITWPNTATVRYAVFDQTKKEGEINTANQEQLAEILLEYRESNIINSFDDCVAAGNAVMKSLPEQCRTSDGRTFVNDKTYPQKFESGVSCQTNADCKLPMEYAIRSSCPFQAYCVDGNCAVACPMWEHSQKPEESVSYEVACSIDSDCNCDNWAGSESYPCRCLDGQCAAVVAQ